MPARFGETCRHETIRPEKNGVEAESRLAARGDPKGLALTPPERRTLLAGVQVMGAAHGLHP